MTNVAILSSIMAVAALIEVAVPMFNRQSWSGRRRVANLGLTAVVFLLKTIWRFLFVIVPVWMIGIPTLAVVVQRLVSAANGILEHGNIRLWKRLDRASSVVWVTPNVHKIHHSRQLSETNSNHGNVLTIYDRMLCTFTPSDRAESVVYGLDNADPTRIGSFGGLLSMPFQAEVQGSLTQKSGSGSAYTDNIPA